MAEITSPPQIEIRQITVATTIALNGERAMMLAVAAGVIANAKISNVPTAGTAMVMTPAIIVIKQMFMEPGSYNHLTLPKIYPVWSSVDDARLHEQHPALHEGNLSELY